MQRPLMKTLCVVKLINIKKEKRKKKILKLRRKHVNVASVLQFTYGAE